MFASTRAYLSVASDFRPSSIADCYGINGELDLFKFLQYQEKCSDLARAERNALLQHHEESDDDAVTTSTKRTRRRHCKALTPHYFDEEGNMIYLKPRETVWWHLYVQSPLVDDKKFNHKFRRRFRMAYWRYQMILVKVVRHDLFRRWSNGKDATGKSASPLELMLLGSLRYLGRGLTFDDLEEYTAVHEETHRQFLHVFIQWGSAVFYNQQVQMPRNK